MNLLAKIIKWASDYFQPVDDEKTLADMEEDVEYFKHNWGMPIEIRNTEHVTELILSRDKNVFEIEDEFIGVIQNRGYEVAYVDYGDWETAFIPT